MENVIDRIVTSRVGCMYEPAVARVDFKDFYVTIDTRNNIICRSLRTFNGCILPVSAEQKQKIIEMIEAKVVEREKTLQDMASNLSIEF